MDRKNLNGFLFLVLVFFGLLLASGKVSMASLWPVHINLPALRWRIAWMAIGAAVGFAIVWGKRIAPDQAFWGLLISLLLALLLL